MSNLANDLNCEQRASIQAKGHSLVIAGPGSGKTRTLIHKISSELQCIESHREFVVALTYTHVAAEEIRDRIDTLGVNTDQLWVGTIHSFCLEWILRPYGIYHPKLASGFSVVDTLVSEELLDELAKGNGIKSGHHDCKYYAARDGFKLDKHVKDHLKEPLVKTFREYHRILLENRQIDFEMMLWYAYELIMNHPPIAPRLNSLFRLVAVDEYQDTKDIQYHIVAEIVKAAASSTRLFVVGDPNQAIFSSLGGLAVPHKELQLLIAAPIAKFELSNNYRSSQQIVDYFTNFAVEPMEIRAAGEDQHFTGELVHDSSTSRDDLVQSLAELIRYNIEVLGINPNEICIVAGWWIHLASVTRSLVQELPEYEFNGPGLSPFGQNLDNFWYKIARIALTQAAPDMYQRRMRWAAEITEQLIEAGDLNSAWTARDFLKVSNGIDVKAQKGSEYLSQYFDLLLSGLNIQLRDGTEISSQRVSFFERIHKRVQEIRHRESIEVDELLTFQRVFRTRRGIVLSTVHGVKGMEFDTMIAFGMHEGIVPNFNEPDSEKPAAAKRLLYVIGSRARKHLFLLSEEGRKVGYKVAPPSRILQDVSRYYRYTADTITSFER